MECGKHSNFHFPEGHLGQESITTANLLTFPSSLWHWGVPGHHKVLIGCFGFRSCTYWLVPHWDILLKKSYPVVSSEYFRTECLGSYCMCCITCLPGV